MADAMGQVDNKVMLVHFEVSCTQTKHGEHVIVVGSTPELGNWDVNKGFRLGTHHSCYPIWKSDNPVVLPKDTTALYKFVIHHEGRPPSEAMWEHLSNRMLQAKPGLDVTIQTSF